MRILHVSDCYLPGLGGIELHVHDLAARQRRVGDQVRVATTMPGPGTVEGSVIRLASDHGIPSRQARNDLHDLIASGNVDVVHAHSSLFSPLAWTAARAADATGTPCTLTMHSMLPRGVVAHAWGAVFRGHLPNVNWTAVSTAAASALRRVVGDQPVTVLPNGIDRADWLPRHTKPAGEPLTMVSVMRMSRRKRPLPLLKILATVRREVPAAQPLRAVLIGSGPLDRAVRADLSASGLETWVSQTGRLTRAEIRERFARADLYLAPATMESFGIAALEARCAGLPVIGMACGGISDFIRPGVEGLLAVSDTDMAMQAAQLLRTPSRLQRMQRHNRRSASAITWPRVLELHRLSYIGSGAVELDPGAEMSVSVDTRS